MTPRPASPIRNVNDEADLAKLIAAGLADRTIWEAHKEGLEGLQLPRDTHVTAVNSVVLVVEPGGITWVVECHLALRGGLSTPDRPISSSENPPAASTQTHTAKGVLEEAERLDNVELEADKERAIDPYVKPYLHGGGMEDD